MDPAKVLKLGLPYNMPAFSLQRSQYVNGLTDNADTNPYLPPKVYRSISGTLLKDMTIVHSDLQCDFPMVADEDRPVPFFPYNFHAGNYWDREKPELKSPQDATICEMLDSGLTPVPTWVFSPRFPLELLAEWTKRQLSNFDQRGRKCHQIRIKNPGQGVEWTAAEVWKHCQTILTVFAETEHLRGLDTSTATAALTLPIIYVHNHDFNGGAGHVGKEVLQLAQKNSYRYLVVDAGYRKNGTHNDNTVLSSVCKFDNENQQLIEKVLCRFDSRDSQMTPWDSDWAGGTEGSDLRIAKEYGLSPADIEKAKNIASEVFPLERAVTPFSEYKLRLGIAIMIEPMIFPKDARAVYSFLEQDHGRLN
eukprot:g19519.t1